MSTDKIYGDLEKELSQFWTHKEDFNVNKENANQYLKSFSDLRYFADRATGKMLYSYDENGAFKSLDYKAIAEKNEELKQENEQKTKEYIDNLFVKTNEYFRKISFIDELSNHSRLHYKFGKGKSNYSFIEQIGSDFSLLRMKSLGELIGISPRYVINAINFIEKIDKKNGKAIEELYNNKQADLAMNSFVTLCQINYNELGDAKFDANGFADEKIMKIISALDDIDKDECIKARVKNRITPHLLNYASGFVNQENLFKYSNAAMKQYQKKDED